ncbi:MAG: AAA family ATPase [Chloroflexi bacterium]|nr:AAA family ATPase [Chloroflexota bacterium]
MATPDQPSPLLGREAEWESCAAFLADLASGPSALLIEGEAGIGKTAIWQAAVRVAEGDGIRVLTARPAGTDATVSYAVLLDLFDGLEESALRELPAPQRDALEVALRRRASEESADPGTIAVAVLGVVRALQRETPLLIAVDDLHVVDPAGGRVLEFIVRRIRAERVGIMAARRAEGGDSLPLRLAEALPAERLRHVRPMPLSVGALHRLIATRVGAVMPRPLVVRIHATTGGNPQFALEIARELEQRGIDTVSPSAPLPVPGTVQEVVGRRLGRLTSEARRIVAFAAEMEHPTRSKLRHVAGDEDLDRALDEASDASILVPDANELRFSHPTVRAAATLAMSEPNRRTVHRRLAEIATDPEERAHHLGRSSVDPDETVAAGLDAGADAATRRGASESALWLLERAVQLTPAADAPARARRHVALADLLSDVGDTTRARALLEGVLQPAAGATPGTRYEAAILLGTLLWFVNEGNAGRAILRRALEEAAGDRPWEARIHARLAWLVDDDTPQAARHAEAALERLDPKEEPGAYAFALLAGATARIAAGHPPDEEAIRRGAAIQESAQPREISSVPGLFPKYADRFDESRAWLERDLARQRSIGDEASMGQNLGYLAELEMWVGDLAGARRHAEEGIELVRQTGLEGLLAVALARLVMIESIEGHDEAAQAGFREMRRLDSDEPWTSAMCCQVEAFLALSRGDFASVDRATSKASELVASVGLVEPAMYRFHADQIEAVIEIADFERAERLLERFEERNRIFPRPWIAATSARCRALLAAARGDLPAAIADLERALVEHERLDMPLERVRTLIVGARILRRANRRKRAYELATEAAGTADAIGARPWAVKARAEAERLGLEHGEVDRLTPSERRMAELAAGGATNRQIADRLLVSPKTVEATLARAYGKLGIRSRAQLHESLGEERS